MRLLYLQPSLVPPPTDPAADRFYLLSTLSSELEGEVLQPVWSQAPGQLQNLFGKEAWPRLQRGRFHYRWFLAWRFTGIQRTLRTLWFYIAEGLRAHREKPVDCVMVYSHMTTALCGIVLKLLTGAKLVVEVVTAPDLIFLCNRPRPNVADRIRRWYSDACLHVSLWSCDCAHLLYPSQLDAYPMLRKVRRAVFHEFVPLGAIR